MSADLPLMHMALAAGAGAVAGTLFFASLGPVARMLASGRIEAVGLQLLRFVALGLVLWLMARAGGAVLLSGAVGVMVGRALVMRRAGR
uniref:N-ATPase subunit AtpR n=1 Tax=Paenirhodobacter enshiensis TaxID=1105367 RepID=UPI0035AD9E43